MNDWPNVKSLHSNVNLSWTSEESIVGSLVQIICERAIKHG